MSCRHNWHRALLVLKPGFAHLGGEAINFIRANLRGELFAVTLTSPLRLTPSQVEEIWGGARKAMGDKLWGEMAEYLTNVVQPLVLDAPRGPLKSPPAEEFPAAVRRLVGPTDPRKSGPDTLRGRFAKIPATSPTYYRNVVHAATDPVEVAANLDALNIKLVEEWRVVP